MDRLKYYEGSIEEERPNFNIEEIKIPDGYRNEVGIYDELTEDEKNEKNWVTFRRLEDEIKKDFPPIYRGNDIIHDEKIEEELDNKLRQFYAGNVEAQKIIDKGVRTFGGYKSQIPFAYSDTPDLRAGRRGTISQLYYIASYFKEARLDEKDPIADIRQVLQGKKILVLGDDTGSLSEMLRFYGAESYGIEYMMNIQY